MKLDTIIAVKDVNSSANWYKEVFGFKRKHGGDDFAVLVSESGEIVLCLHRWGEHEHPTMINSETTPGNGLILYFKTDDLNTIRNIIRHMAYPFEEEIHQNPNSTKREFSLRDPDGYYLIITEYHEYNG